MSTNQDVISSYQSQLNSRFYSNSIALQVLLCLIMILILIIQIIKFFKKTYEWQTEYEIILQRKYAQESKQSLREKSQVQGIDNHSLSKSKQDKRIEEIPEKIRGERMRKEYNPPAIIKFENVIKNKVPQLAIIAVNVVMIASYEFCVIIAYIAIVLIVIGQIVGQQHLKLKLGLELLSKILMIIMYINIFTVTKPSPP